MKNQIKNQALTLSISMYLTLVTHPAFAQGKLGIDKVTDAVGEELGGTALVASVVGLAILIAGYMCLARHISYMTGIGIVVGTALIINWKTIGTFLAGLGGG